LARTIHELIAECDREVERQNAKLKESEEEKAADDPLTRQLAELQAQADKLGEEGKIDEYLSINASIDALKIKQQEQANQLPDLSGMGLYGRPPQKLRVCEICGCYLSKFDNDQRLIEGHYVGKLHTGYKELREKFAELKKDGHWTSENEKEENRRSTTVHRHDDRDRPR